MLTPPRSGTAVFVGGFPLGACFCNYGMHKLDIQHDKTGGVSPPPPNPCGNPSAAKTGSNVALIQKQ